MKRDARLAAISACLLLLAWFTGAKADENGNWPQWRGPNRDNISPDTGLLKKWPPDGPPKLWEGSGLGEGYSSVSVANGKIFTMGDQRDGCYAIALDSGGHVTWKTKIGPPAGVDYPGPRATPTYDEGHIYVLGQLGDLACLDDKGTIVWQKNMYKDFKGQMMSGWGYAESPLVDGPNLICTPGGPQGTLLALNKKTGEVVWRTKDWSDRAAYCSVVIANIGGKRQYVQLTDQNVAGVDAQSGQVLWKAQRRGGTAVIPTPVVKDNLIFVTSGYGAGCDLFEVAESGGKLDAKHLYHQDKLSVKTGGVVLVGDYVYGSHGEPGILTCLELKTGKIMWTDRSLGGKGAVTYADGCIYLRVESGAVGLIEATPKAYHEISRFQQPDRSDKAAWPHPVITGGRLYLRDADKLLCYDLRAK